VPKVMDRPEQARMTKARQDIRQDIWAPGKKRCRRAVGLNRAVTETSPRFPRRRTEPGRVK